MSRSLVWSSITFVVLFIMTSVFYFVPSLANPYKTIPYNVGTIVYQITLLVPVIFLFISYTGIDKQWKGHRAWLFILLALVFYFIGDTVWNVYDLFWQVEAPHPGIADAAYIIFYPLVILAMLRFIKVADVKLTPSETLLIGIIAALLAAEAIGRIIVPAFLDSSSPILANIIDSFYVLSDVAILCLGLIIIVQFWGGRVTTTYILFVIAMFIMSICDAIYTLQPEIGLRNPLDLGWTASYMLMALASVHERSLHYKLK